MAAKLLKTATFRLAITFAALFALAAVMFVTVFDWSVWRYAERSTMAALEAESTLMRNEVVREGHRDIGPLIAEREHIPGSQYFYLWSDASGRRLAGSLPPRAVVTGAGQLLLPLPSGLKDIDNQQIQVRTFGARLPDGSLLVVGRNMYPLTELREWITKMTVLSAAGVIVLALVGGLLIGTGFLRRLEAVNGAAARIMNGDLKERLPTIGMGDEFDQLSANLNRMLDRIESLMESLRQVSSDIAHDLRTPLTHIRNRLRALKPGQSAPAEYETAVAQTLVEADQMLATFGALLLIGQVEGGAARTEFAPVDLAALLNWIAEAYGPAAEDAGKHLRLEAAPAATVLGHKDLLTQLFANLVSNAIAHTPAGAEIVIRLTNAASHVTVAVSDTGPGIPASERQRVLTRFVRLDHSRTTPGAGLGLALVSAICDLHDARLELSDNAPGLTAAVTFAPSV